MASILSFAEHDVPEDLRAQILALHNDAWPDAETAAHDPALRPQSLLLVERGDVLAALDILSKDIVHRDERGRRGPLYLRSAAPAPL